MAKMGKLQKSLARYQKEAKEAERRARVMVKYEKAPAAAKRLAAGEKSAAAKRPAVGERAAAAEATTKVKARRPPMTVIHVWSDGIATERPIRREEGVHAGDAILVIGDGDFTFSQSLLVAPPAKPRAHLICTTLDTKEDALAKYPQRAGDAVALLEATARCSVAYAFDGTRLSIKYLRSKVPSYAVASPPMRITRIIFNFPHSGEGIKDRAYNIRAQQKLLAAFFKAAADFLSDQEKCPDTASPSPTSLLVRRSQEASPEGAARALANDSHALTSSAAKKKRIASRNGDDDDDDRDDSAAVADAAGPKDSAGAAEERAYCIPRQQQCEIHLTMWEGDPYDDWGVKRLAKATGKLHLIESFRFIPRLYRGYKHVRTAGEHKLPRDGRSGDTFSGRSARTYVFVLSTKPQ